MDNVTPGRPLGVVAARKKRTPPDSLIVILRFLRVNESARCAVGLGPTRRFRFACVPPNRGDADRNMGMGGIVLVQPARRSC